MTKRLKAEEALRHELAEKKTLLREINHRVKNNLQIIQSLINLQLNHVHDDTFSQEMKVIRNRIHSISLVHESLYQTEEFSQIDLKTYTGKLATELINAFSSTHKKIALIVSGKTAQLDIAKAVPLGIVLNELISNSIKYAFPPGRSIKPCIEINLQIDNHYEMCMHVSDNGIGLPKQITFENSDTLGLMLCQLLVRDQLGGRIEIERRKGTKFKIYINLDTISSRKNSK